MSETAEAFELWIRRGAGESAWSVRFETRQGKGLLRVQRPGMLIDPPARPTGSEDRMTSAALRATRFLYVADAGRVRHTWSLERLEDLMLERVRTDEWTRLAAHREGTASFLVLDSGALTRPIIEEQPPGAADQRLMLEGFEREVAALVERGRDRLHAMTGEDDPIEAGSATEEEPIEAAADTDEHEVVATVRAHDPRAAPIVSHLSTGPALDAGVWDEGGEVAGASERTTDPGRINTEPLGRALRLRRHPVDVVPQSAFDLAPTPSTVSRDVQVRTTSLIRHLRRRIADDQARIAALEARVRALEAQVAVDASS